MFDVRVKEPHQESCVPIPAAALHTTARHRPNPAPLPDEGELQESQFAPDTGHCVGRQAPTIFIEFVCIKPTIQLCLLLSGKRIRSSMGKSFSFALMVRPPENELM